MKKFLLQSLRISLVSFLFLLSIIPTSYAGISLIPTTPGQRQFSFEIKPGQEQKGMITLENLDNKKVNVHLYSADGTQSNQGTFALTTLATPQKHIGNWITFTQPEQTLEPLQKKEIPFIVKIPANATPGTYSGGIAAESSTALDKKTGKSGVSISSRIVVKVFVNVPGAKNNQYEWQDFSYNAGIENRKPSFNLTYKNLGNTVILIDQKIEVSGFPYSKKQTLDLPIATLLQGSESTLSQKWVDQPFFGFYKANATINFSEYDIINNKKLNGQTLSKEINIYVPLKLDTTEGRLTLTLIVVILCLLIGYLFWLLREMQLRKNFQGYKVKADETVSSIAENYNIPWKRLAKINKLSPPYNLKPGQTILVPGIKKPKKI